MKLKNSYFISSVIVLILLNPTVTNAQPDKESGSVKFETCAGCHSLPGYANAVPRFQVPKLAGQQSGYLVSALKAYSRGERKHPGMRGNAEGLTDQDIEDIVAYLTSFKPVAVKDNYRGNVKLGEDLAAGCMGCHGAGGSSTDDNFPILAGQYQSYLVKVLKDYQSVKRNNPMMAGMVKDLSDEEIENISAFYASQAKGLGIVNR